jgi:pyrroline-5-carboxylate reductase
MTRDNAKAPASLADFTGTLLLVGAGKMGGAMLEGWLALGMAARNVVVIEPQPAGEIAALTGRGLRLNPPPGDIGEVSALVLAIKCPG